MKSMKRLPPYRFRRPAIIAFACAAFVIGIFVAQKPGTWWLWWLMFLAPLGLVRCSAQNVRVLLCAALCCFGFGIWRGHSYQRQVLAYEVLFKQKVVLVGMSLGDATYDEHKQLTTTVGHVRLVSPRAQPLVGTISVGGFGTNAIFRGDEVRLYGSLYPTLGGNQARMSFAAITVLSHHDSWLDTVRRKFAAGVMSALPEPAASFGLGVLIGQRSTLPADVATQLTHVGLVHVIAVSGYNLTIILQAARRLVGKRSKFQATVLFGVFIGLFVVLTGSSPSIVRAAIVSLVGIVAWYYGRTFKPVTLLLLAAAITAFVNPLYVWGNVSWYLSFLAFVGVMLLAPLVSRRLFRSRNPHILVAILFESLCAEICTLPYVLYIFGQMSLISLLANVLVVALVPLAMLLALVAGLAGMWLPNFAGLVALPARYVLTYMLDAARVLSQIPHTFIEHIGFPLWQMIAAYGVVGLLLGVLWRHPPKSAIITDKIAEKTEGT